MNWLLQNWVWIVVLALGAVWMFRRGGLAGFGMGGHGGQGGFPSWGGGQTHESSSHGDAPPSADTSGKAIDPVSGHEVLAAQAITAAYQGRIVYFESAENRQRFEATPEQYARNLAPLPPPQHRRHGC
jgi:YHS domain-containing protein